MSISYAEAEGIKIGMPGEVPAISAAMGLLTGALLVAPRRWWMPLAATMAAGTAAGAFTVGMPAGTAAMRNWNV